MVDITPPRYWCAPHTSDFVTFEMAKQLQRTLYFINLHGFYNSKGEFGILDENFIHYQAPTYAQIFQTFEHQLHVYTRFHVTYPNKNSYFRKYRYTMRAYNERHGGYENLLNPKKYSPYFNNIEDAQVHAANFLMVVYKYMEYSRDYRIAHLHYSNALKIIAEERFPSYQPSIIEILETIEKIQNN